MPRVAIIFAFLFCLFLPVRAQAQERYVATTGSDSNSGSSAAPWRTVGHGIDSVQPGQTLIVRGGTYRENVSEIVNAGSAASPVTVRAATGERPVVEGKFWAENADYWTFNGINVTWGFTGLSSGTQMVRVIRSDYWRWTNSELWNAHSTAQMGIQQGHGYRVDHNYMHHTVPSNNTNQDHVIYASTVGGFGAGGTGTIERNILADSPNGRGIKINGDGLTVRFNTMVDNTGPSNIQLSDDADDNVIYRNILVHPHSGYRNITRYSLSGTNNVAYQNVGWQSMGVVDAGTGLTDGGGNLFIDPQLVDFRPQNPAAQAYGRYAGETPTPPPPDTVIDDLVLGEGFQVYATFHGIWQTANGGTFQCAVFYWTFWEPCSSPKTYQNLPSGSSTMFGVRAVEQGQIDPTPAWWPFTVP